MKRQIIKRAAFIICSLFIILKDSCSYGQAISHSAMRYAVVINSLNHDSVDMFITSGHGNYNLWQMHYPTQSPEGTFRSEGGGVTGIANDGVNYQINSSHPKIWWNIM
jgi:hypothetical protein